MKLAKTAGLTDSSIRLPVLYEKCFQEEVDPSSLHNAVVDVDLCSRIYFYLREKMQEKVYLPVEYKDKEVFKFLGGLWDSEKRMWYVYKCHRFYSYVESWFK
jgi:hypothetical protein